MGDLALRQDWEEMHTKISTEQEFKEACSYKGLTCMEVHAGWCGPCTPVINVMKKLHWELVKEKGAQLKFVVANSDKIDSLKPHMERSKPLFFMYRNGRKVHSFDGVNPPALKSFIEEHTPSKADVVEAELMAASGAG
ncbi:hypothetical protein T484DRAFT_1788846 [Baffinella frigidus]|nr:hypothetical protein T484DRAFT_1788846 [Cryptophyta sp. CCMP2293]